MVWIFKRVGELNIIVCNFAGNPEGKGPLPRTRLELMAREDVSFVNTKMHIEVP
jgi:hypothetical protein